MPVTVYIKKRPAAVLMPSLENRHYLTLLPGSFCRSRLQLHAASDSCREEYITCEGALRNIYSHQDRNLPVLSQGIDCCLNITDLGTISFNFISNFEPLGTFSFQEELSNKFSKLYLEAKIVRFVLTVMIPL